MVRYLAAAVCLVGLLAAGDAAAQSKAQKAFYKNVASYWADANAGSISSSFDSIVELDLCSHCKKGKYKKKQAANMLKTHLTRHITPIKKTVKIIKMTASWMKLRFNYRDLVTGQLRQHHLYFYAKAKGGSYIITAIKP